MSTTPQQAAARAEVVGRLAAFREARAALHADIHRAAELGMTKTEIARASGLTRQGVAKILNPPETATPSQACTPGATPHRPSARPDERLT